MMIKNETVFNETLTQVVDTSLQHKQKGSAAPAN